jgi:hypothetical protein
LPTQERYEAYESLARRRRGGERLVVRKIGEEIDFREQGTTRVEAEEERE